jgi:alkanesulfonate monooxygenase SsuD/methylene tetrahydromethanopterin reductase-like flavin-dependent oxidoreductase (luciferase family)
MRFAHFAHVWGKAGMTPAQRYAQLWRELALCDEVGFDYGFCVEHHFTPDESWMSAPNIYAASVAARTRRIGVGGMGHVVPLHHPVRLSEEIALLDQVTGGRLEVGLVPGVSPRYFGPYNADYANQAGWQRKAEIGYSTVVYVDKSDSEAIDKAPVQAARAYRGFFGNPKTQAEHEERKNENARRHEEKGDFLGGEIVRNLLNPDYLLENDLVVIGSPETVAKKIKSFAIAGHFNVFIGEFNFGDIAEDDLMRSIRLFGEAVIPELHDFVLNRGAPVAVKTAGTA